MQCPSCSAIVDPNTRFCASCGAKLEAAEAPPTPGTPSPSEVIYPKNPPLSPNLAWLALIQPGIPHLVFGQVGKGIVLTLAFWLSLPTVIGPLLILAAAIIDAYKVGSTLQQGKTVGKWQFFPS